MAPPLAELTAHAQTLSSAGDLVGARRLLGDVLKSADADPRRATADLALAAALHARILIALGDPHGARLWAGFAHAAEERLHGPQHERTVAAAATHAAVLQRVGHHGRAAQVYHQLVGDLSELDGPDSPRVLAAEADLATAEHAAGHCTAARARLREAWERHRRRYGDAAPAGIKMLARLGAMERECGRDAESREHLALAQELCARYLPTDHPLVRQAAALAVAQSSGRHVCGRVEQSSGPVSAPGVTTVGGPGVRSNPFPRRPTVPDPAQIGAVSGPAQIGAVSNSAQIGAVPDPAQSGAVPDPAQSGAVPDPAQSGAVSDSAQIGFPPDDPTQPPPDERETDPNGNVYQQPLYLSDVSRPHGELTGRHARADTPPPLPGERAPDYGPQVKPPPAGRAPASTLTTPPNSERRLPVRVEQPRPRRSGQPFVLAAVLVAGVGAAAAVVILTLPDASANPSAAPSAGASAGAPPTTNAAPTVKASATTPAGVAPTAPAKADPGAPTGVRLQDAKDSVTLQWTYPKNAEGPVLISGSREGQQRWAFQQLPAGTDNYIVYGLNTDANYCFTVAVAYSGNRVANSVPVCTKR